MQQKFLYSSLILLIMIVLIGTSLSQELTQTVDSSPSSSPSAEQTASHSPTPSPSPSTTATATLTPTSTATLSQEVTPELTEPVEVTVEVTVPVLEITETSEVTAEITETAAEASPEVTAPSIELTENPELTETAELTAEITQAREQTATAEITEFPISSVTPTATPGGIPLTVIRGSVHYQNRQSHAGISVLVLSLDDILLSVAQTNETGIFSIPAPSNQAFYLVLEAPLHRRMRVLVEPTTTVPQLIMAGGDLNQDACINQVDLNLLLASYETENSPQTDVNLDGLTDLADLAILTGNFEANCGEELLPEATASADSDE